MLRALGVAALALQASANAGLECELQVPPDPGFEIMGVNPFTYAKEAVISRLRKMSDAIRSKVGSLLELSPEVELVEEETRKVVPSTRKLVVTRLKKKYQMSAGDLYMAGEACAHCAPRATSALRKIASTRARVQQSSTPLSLRETRSALTRATARWLQPAPHLEEKKNACSLHRFLRSVTLVGEGTPRQMPRRTTPRRRLLWCRSPLRRRSLLRRLRSEIFRREIRPPHPYMPYQIQHRHRGVNCSSASRKRGTR